MRLFDLQSLKNRPVVEDSIRPDPLRAAIVDNFPGGLCVFDHQQRMVLCNERLKRMLGYSEDLFEFGMPTLEQIFRYNALRGEYGEGDPEKHVSHRMELAKARVPHIYERVRPNGMVIQVRGVPLDEGGFLTLYFDVTHERNAVATKPQQPGVKILSGPQSLMENLDAALSKLRPGTVLGVHCFDLDRFAALNSEYGRPAGDAVIDSVTQRVAAVLREGDSVAHLRGDRYAVLQTNIIKPSDVIAVERRFIEAIRKPHKVGALEIPVSASCGLALAPRDGLVPEVLLAHAEHMMLKAKQRDPGFRPSMEF